MSNEEINSHLKSLIKNAEDRILYYKSQLEYVNRNKTEFPSEDELVIWYKALLRDIKNEEEKHLKRLVKEKTHHSLEMNSLQNF